VPRGRRWRLGRRWVSSNGMMIGRAGGGAYDGSAGEHSGHGPMIRCADLAQWRIPLIFASSPSNGAYPADVSGYMGGESPFHVT